MSRINNKKFGRKFRLTIECDDMASFQIACKKAASEFFTEKKNSGIHGTSRYGVRFHEEELEEELEEGTAKGRYEREQIEGKQQIVWYLQSKINEE